MRMSGRFGIAILFLCFLALPAIAQESRFEVAAGFTYVHSNAPAGGCGCFSLNGGSGSAFVKLLPRLDAVAAFTGVHVGNVDSSGQPLTLLSYEFGPRVPLTKHSRFTPFAEGLVGAAHASGLTYGGSGIPATALAAEAGGGLDVRVKHVLAVRLFEADYSYLHFQNGVNSRENNIRVTFGIVLRFGRP
jgi:outer membrane immunogenic protein